MPLVYSIFGLFDGTQKIYTAVKWRERRRLCLYLGYTEAYVFGVVVPVSLSNVCVCVCVIAFVHVLRLDVVQGVTFTMVKATMENPKLLKTQQVDNLRNVQLLRSCCMIVQLLRRHQMLSLLLLFLRSCAVPTEQETCRRQAAASP